MHHKSNKRHSNCYEERVLYSLIRFVKQNNNYYYDDHVHRTKIGDDTKHTKVGILIRCVNLQRGECFDDYYHFHVYYTFVGQQ